MSPTNLIELDEYRRHLVIQAPGKVHVFPLAMFDDVITGKLKPSAIDDLDSWLPMVIKEWIETLDC